MSDYSEPYWWCPYCRAEVDPRNVTYTEQHDACGHTVEWVENKPQPTLSVTGVLCAETDMDWSVGNVAVFSIHGEEMQEKLRQLQGQRVQIDIKGVSDAES